MKSLLSLTASTLIHGAAVVALSSAHAPELIPPGTTEIEISEGDGEYSLGEQTQTPEPVQKGEETAAEEKVEVAPVVKAPVEKKVEAKPKKPVVAALPKKEVVEETPQAAPTPQETVAAVEPSDESTEAAPPVVAPIPPETTEAAQTQEAMNALGNEANEGEPQEGAEKAKGSSDSEESTGAAAAFGAAGGTRSYLDLKQNAGNRPPEYPAAARRAGQEGSVKLEYFVTNDGRVKDVKIVESSGHGILDDAAVKAVSKYKFVPGQEGWANHPVHFALKGQIEPSPARLRTMGAASSAQ